MRTGLTYSDVLDDRALNQEEANDKIKNLLKVDHISVGGTVELDIYQDTRNSVIDDSFINQTPLIASSYIYVVQDNDMYIKSVWNSRESKGLAFYLLFDYYLPKFKSITSDNKQSTQGERFWKRILERAEKDNYIVKAVVKSKEIDLDDKDRFWGSTSEFYNYQLRIYSK